MDYEVTLSKQAEEDLANIYSYILNNLRSLINADAVLERLYSAMQDLSFMAKGYHLYQNEPWYSLGVHYFSVGNYTIFYVCNDAENKAVATVIHVAYEKRNLDNVLSDFT